MAAPVGQIFGAPQDASACIAKCHVAPHNLRPSAHVEVLTPDICKVQLGELQNNATKNQRQMHTMMLAASVRSALIKNQNSFKIH